MDDERDRELLEMLAARLERLSADSKWAHRASGVRGQVLRALETGDGRRVPLQDASRTEDRRRRTKGLIEAAFYILQQAAKEL